MTEETKCPTCGNPPLLSGRVCAEPCNQQQCAERAECLRPSVEWLHGCPLAYDDIIDKPTVALPYGKNCECGAKSPLVAGDGKP